MRGLSPKIISRDSQRSENTQTQYISIQYNDIEVEVEVITVSVPCIRFTQVEAKRVLQNIEQSFTEAVFSHVKHTLFALGESGLPRTTYACESL
jgi:hypothetical protein